MGQEDHYTVFVAARKLNLSPSAVKEMVAEGELAAEYVEGQKVITARSLQDYRKRQLSRLRNIPEAQTIVESELTPQPVEGLPKQQKKSEPDTVKTWRRTSNELGRRKNKLKKRIRSTSDTQQIESLQKELDAVLLKLREHEQARPERNSDASSSKTKRTDDSEIKRKRPRKRKAQSQPQDSSRGEEAWKWRLLRLNKEIRSLQEGLSTDHVRERVQELQAQRDKILKDHGVRPKQRTKRLWVTFVRSERNR